MKCRAENFRITFNPPIHWKFWWAKAPPSLWNWKLYSPCSLKYQTWLIIQTHILAEGEKEIHEWGANDLIELEKNSRNTKKQGKRTSIKDYIWSAHRLDIYVKIYISFVTLPLLFFFLIFFFEIYSLFFKFYFFI